MLGELNLKKETKILNAALKKFLKNPEEERRLVKEGDFFNLDQIKELC